MLKQERELHRLRPKESQIFHWARTGDLDALIEALSTGAQIDLEEKNNQGYTPLMLAIYNQQFEFAKSLIAVGVSIHEEDPAGNTVLMITSYKGNVDMLNLLLEKGASLDSTNAAGMQAYDWAKAFNRSDILEVLDSKLAKIKPVKKLSFKEQILFLSRKYIQRIFSKKQEENI
ncbi:MAG: ankyrin repeat domain-containing protein [Bdellovibrionota bacterium]|nr:ankyrin domain-containing protein [Pseudobdellovibrionaceae bacterium]|tara:strand:+ start:58940 stop:59461 length:522 start_codon:yes stop_codon:yes gene_type:complete